ncbi:MAG: acyl-CoA synthetase [Candidatus Dadabacteria bacterium]|nr:MAG: acyl-CoA synthetase [Candidatus Dadabacteria bacterium]
MSWNIADIWERIAATIPSEPALLHRDRTISWSEFDRQATAMARRLLAGGARPGDKIAIYSHNRPEYLIAVFAAIKARLIPVNVNYRYRLAELEYLFDNSDAVAVVFEGSFAERLAEVRPRLPKLRDFIHIEDGTPRPPWASSFEDAVSGESEPLGIERSPDDLIFIYTGGTTGMPKGVMWRQEDIWRTLGAGGDFLTGRGKPATLDEHADAIAAASKRMRLLPACPLMHGTGLLTAISTLVRGGSIVTLAGRRFDPHELWSEVEAKQVDTIAIVGDVFARPMLDALAERHYDISSVRVIISSGVLWSPEVKKGLLAYNRHMVLLDTLGASEGTGFGTSITTAEGTSEPARFKVGSRVKVFTDDGREVRPGSGERGRVARSGAIPIGYYKDPEKTAETFPVIGGVRYAMPGDYATVAADGTLVLLGRGSVCINTGGEKVFPEEVESVLRRHPAVADAAVVGLPDPRWGEAVTALVTARQGGPVPGESDLREHVRRHLAGYKVPKRIFTVESLPRSPAGKLDYKAARELAAQLAGTKTNSEPTTR